MKTSEQIDKITPAFIAMQDKLLPIVRRKEVKTGKYSYKYAPLDDVVELLKPLMREHGFGYTQPVDKDCVTTRLLHISGQWFESETHLHQDHASMQQMGGEISFLRRYALASIVGLVSEDDTDAQVPRISATKGALDNLPPKRQSMITDIAAYIVEKFDEGDEYGAYEEACNVTEQDEKIALWSLLPSKVRTCMTKLGKAEREGAKA